MDQQSSENAILHFLSRLRSRAGEDGEIIKRFIEAASSPAGQVVLADSAQEYENQLRDQAEATTTMAFAAEMFEKSGNKFALKKEHADFPLVSNWLASSLNKTLPA